MSGRAASEKARWDLEAGWVGEVKIREGREVDGMGTSQRDL